MLKFLIIFLLTIIFLSASCCRNSLKVAESKELFEDKSSVLSVLSDPAVDSDQIFLRLVTCSCYEVRIFHADKLCYKIKPAKSCKRKEYSWQESSKKKFKFLFYYKDKIVDKVERKFNPDEPTEIRLIGKECN